MLSLNVADTFKGKEAKAETTPTSLQDQDDKHQSWFLSTQGHSLGEAGANFIEVYECAHEYIFRIIFHFLVNTSFAWCLKGTSFSMYVNVGTSWNPLVY